MSSAMRVTLALVAVGLSGCSPIDAPSATTPIQPPTTLVSAPPTTETAVAISTLGNGTENLDPGTYLLDFQAHAAGSRAYPQVEITVPEGWANIDSWGVRARPDTPRWTAVTFWDVEMLYAHPCNWRGEKIDPGRTVNGLVTALIDRPMRNSSRPLETTVDGYPGYLVEWSVPADIDFSSCDEGYFESWTAAGRNSDRYLQGPGQTDFLWIVDVDGSRLVIEATHMPGATDQDLVELFTVVDSIRFRSVTDGEDESTRPRVDDAWASREEMVACLWADIFL